MNDTPQHPQPQPSPSDDELMAAVGTWLDRAEPIPPEVLDAAYAAFGMGRLHEELAELTFDSAGALAGMRAVEAEARMLTFSHDQVTLDIEMSADGKSIIGQVTPADGAKLIVESDDGDDRTAEVDEHGRFRVSVPGWPVRLRLVGRVVTPWINP